MGTSPSAGILAHHTHTALRMKLHESCSYIRSPIKRNMTNKLKTFAFDYLGIL